MTDNASDEWIESSIHETAVDDVREMLSSIPREPDDSEDATPVQQPLSYPQERFRNAVRILATNFSKQRLVNAYDEIRCVQRDVLPESVRHDFDWICKKMESKISLYHDQSDLSVTQRGMHNSTREKIAARICLIDSVIN